MLVVLDSNAFHADARADRSLIRSILDEALPKGSFELFVPEVVLQELDKQFAQRSKKAAKEINKAIGEQKSELHELGLTEPAPMTVDPDDVAGYRAALEARLESVGTEILPLPADLSPAVAWAVNRRKPFKQQGDGFPDAAIWLTVLDLALARPEQIMLVTDNTKDFGDGKEPVGLSETLADDLEQRGRPRDQVRLLPGIHEFADELAKQSKAADKLASKLADDGVLEPAIENVLMWSRLDKDTLELGVELDNDPQVVGWDLVSLTIDAAAELPDGRLLITATGEMDLLLDLLIYKADYYIADEDEDAVFRLSDPDFNDHYLEAESDVRVEIQLEITATPDGSDVRAEVVDFSLAPLEIVHRALRGRSLRNLWNGLRAALEGAEVEEYAPQERIESGVEEATVLSIGGGPVTLGELIESDEDRQVCQLDVSFDGDVEWSTSAPTSFDAEQFAGLALNESSGAPILQGYESTAPLIADVSASWDPEHGWHAIEVNSVALEAAELKKRNERMTASEELIADEMLADHEDRERGDA